MEFANFSLLFDKLSQILGISMVPESESIPETLFPTQAFSLENSSVSFAPITIRPKELDLNRLVLGQDIAKSNVIDTKAVE